MSSNSIIDNDICGFARIAMYEVQYKVDGLQHLPLEAATTFKARIINWQRLQFQTLFIDCSSSFDVPYETFRKQLPKIKEEMMKLGKRYGQQKNKLIEGFSAKAWKSLLQEEKIKHTYSSCVCCQNEPMFKLLYDLFPSKKGGCIKQKKITPAPEENNGPSSSEIYRV